MRFSTIATVEMQVFAPAIPMTPKRRRRIRSFMSAFVRSTVLARITLLVDSDQELSHIYGLAGVAGG